MPDLLSVLKLLYHMQPAEVDSLYETILDQRKRAWRSALQFEVANLGLSIPVRDPSGEDLRWLRERSRLDAESIARTWNADVDRQLERLYATNYRGNRHYYISNMEKWAARRDKWKSRQIATTTETTTWEYVHERFVVLNGFKDGQFLLMGPPPVCPICKEMWGAGLVPYRYTVSHPAPAHIACTHTWRLLPSSVTVPAAADIWVGSGS